LAICFANAGSLDCTLCTFLVTEIEDALGDGTTVTWIESHVINATCSLAIFLKYNTVCNTILDYGLIEFIKYVETYQTAEVVCGSTEFNFCSSQFTDKLKWINQQKINKN